MRLAHLSDLHFGRATFSPLQFFSKRWLGNLNLIFRRKAEFLPEQALESLLPFLKSERVEHVLLCGDLTTTSRDEEFQHAQGAVQKMKELGMQVTLLPGNHDCYTRGSSREKRFYRYFPKSLQRPYLHYTLDQHRVAAAHLEENLFLVALDCALATPLHSSQGHFSPEQEAHLEALLTTLPQTARVIVLCHFPFFHHIAKMKQLVRGEALGKLLRRFSQVRLYMHGHTHHQTIANLRVSGFPLILDSGSCSTCRGASCHIVDITSNGMDVTLLRADADFQWQRISSERFHE
jgi:3',5'-cyclic AMP phosphodiesterase CpdA